MDEDDELDELVDEEDELDELVELELLLEHVHLRSVMNLSGILLSD